MEQSKFNKIIVDVKELKNRLAGERFTSEQLNVIKNQISEFYQEVRLIGSKRS